MWVCCFYSHFNVNVFLIFIHTYTFSNWSMFGIKFNGSVKKKPQKHAEICRKKIFQPNGSPNKFGACKKAPLQLRVFRLSV